MILKLPLFLLLLSLPFVGQAVDMPLKSVDGSRTNLQAFKGKWVVVNYWAT